MVLGPVQQESFDQLKTVLIITPALALPNPEQPCYVSETDASGIAVGAVLM